MKTHKFNDGWEAWYERSYRVWVAAKFDAEDNQIGDCVYASAKSTIPNEIAFEEKCRKFDEKNS